MLILGAVMIAGGMYFDSLFTSLETGERESARIHWVLAIVYEKLGHDVAVWTVWAWQRSPSCGE